MVHPIPWLPSGLKMTAGIVFVSIVVTALNRSGSAQQNNRQPPPAGSYMPVDMERDFEAVYEEDTAAKEHFVARQRELLEGRYDLGDHPSDVLMSGGRKPVQQGVRVKLQDGISWQQLSDMTPQQIRRHDLFPMGFRPLPHSKHETGGMVFPDLQIEAIGKAEHRDLQRFDTAFDLPDHLTPEFPPPIFLANRPDLGDVSNGEVLTIKNYYLLMNGKLTPVQIEGLRI